MQKETENLVFVRGVNCEFIDPLNNNCTKCLLIFDDSCEEICNSKAFVDIATAGKLRGMSTIYIEHNLFHQGKLGRDVDLQNTHIVVFKSPRDVIQVTTLCTQLGLGSELVDWYRDATSVPIGHLLVDLSPCTQKINYVIVQASEPFPQNFISRTGCNSQKFWTMTTKNLSTLHFPTKAKIFSFNLAQKETCKHGKTSRGKVPKRNSTIVSKTYNLEAKKRHSGVRKKLTAH